MAGVEGRVMISVMGCVGYCTSNCVYGKSGVERAPHGMRPNPVCMGHTALTLDIARLLLRGYARCVLAFVWACVGKRRARMMSVCTCNSDVHVRHRHVRAIPVRSV